MDVVFKFLIAFPDHQSVCFVLTSLVANIFGCDHITSYILTSLVARILVVVFVFTPAPPWIPHSTRLSFEVIIDMIQKQRHLHMLEKHYNEMSNCEVRRSFRCVATTLALDDERPVTRSGVRQRSATYRDICGARIEMVRLLHIMENTFWGPLTSLLYGIHTYFHLGTGVRQLQLFPPWSALAGGWRAQEDRRESLGHSGGGD